MSGCIDIHTHVVPERFPPCVGCGPDVPWPSMAAADACHKHVVISGKIYRTVPDGCWNVARRVEEMDAMRVSRQVLSPMPELLSYWFPLNHGKTLTRYLNEQIAEMVSGMPTRFAGLGAVPLQDVDSAIRELDFVVGHLKLAGAEIASHVNGVSIGDPRFEPFFAAAEAARAAIFVHALRPAGQDRIVGAFPEQAVCFPGDVALAAASMITGGIAARHPSLRVAFGHGGGGLSMLLPRLVHAWQNVPKARESLAESPAVYAKRFYYDGLVFDATALRFLVDTFGSSQICLGSDYPFAMGDLDPLRTIEKVGFDAAVFEALTYKNAQHFLGF
jgi:aminocarboxymuconate-semialdehyde decarboxylase